jgi:hypothetical protein
MELARRAIRELGTSDMEARFTSEKMIADPALTRMLAQVGEILRGDIGIGTGSSQPSAMTPDQAISEINKLRGDREFNAVRMDCFQCHTDRPSDAAPSPHRNVELHESIERHLAVHADASTNAVEVSIP